MGSQASHEHGRQERKPEGIRKKKKASLGSMHFFNPQRWCWSKSISVTCGKCRVPGSIQNSWARIPRAWAHTHVYRAQLLITEHSFLLCVLSDPPRSTQEIKIEVGATGKLEWRVQGRLGDALSGVWERGRMIVPRPLEILGQRTLLTAVREVWTGHWG